MPTLEGGLRVEITSAMDWLILEHIASDALDESGDGLPERLGVLMDDESDWEDVVIPELRMVFAGQVGRVAEAIRGAQARTEGGSEGASGTLFIRREAAEDWYGALNQARLGLENRFELGQLDEIGGLEGFPDDKRYAYVRSQLYCALQNVLLQFVLE